MVRFELAVDERTLKFVRLQIRVKTIESDTDSTESSIDSNISGLVDSESDVDDDSPVLITENISKCEVDSLALKIQKCWI